MYAQRLLWACPEQACVFTQTVLVGLTPLGRQHCAVAPSQVFKVVGCSRQSVGRCPGRSSVFVLRLQAFRGKKAVHPAAQAEEAAAERSVTAMMHQSASSLSSEGIVRQMTLALQLLPWLFCDLIHDTLYCCRVLHLVNGLPREDRCSFLRPKGYPGRLSKAGSERDAQASLVHRTCSSIRRYASPAHPHSKLGHYILLWSPMRPMH